MTDRDYTVRGCTALLDAIGSAIHHIGNVHKYARPERCPGTYAVHHHHGRNGERQPVLQQRPGEADDPASENEVWLGVPVPRRKHRRSGNGTALWDRSRPSVNYNSDSAGTQLNYEVLSDVISAVRSSAPLGADWKSGLMRTTRNAGKAKKINRIRMERDAFLSVFFSVETGQAAKKCPL